jgi:hypothetical protein
MTCFPDDHCDIWRRWEAERQKRFDETYARLAAAAEAEEEDEEPHAGTPEEVQKIVEETLTILTQMSIDAGLGPSNRHPLDGPPPHLVALPWDIDGGDEEVGL